MAYGESNVHLTDDVTWPRKVKVATAICLGPISRKQLKMLFSNNRWLIDSLLSGSTTGYPGDSLASCYLGQVKGSWCDIRRSTHTRDRCPSAGGRTTWSCVPRGTRHTVPPACSPGSCRHRALDSTIRSPAAQCSERSTPRRSGADLRRRWLRERAADHHSEHGPGTTVHQQTGVLTLTATISVNVTQMRIFRMAKTA